MAILITGLILFILTHLLASVTPLRSSLVSKLGLNAYKGIFSLLALGGLITIIFGMRQAPFVELWTPPAWGKVVVHSVMPFAFILLCAAFVPSNLKRITRHPMLWGIAAWAMLHLLTNGDLASALLFAGLGLWAVIEIFVIGTRQTPEPGSKEPVWKDLILIAVGLVDYALFLYFHSWVSGVAIVS